MTAAPATIQYACGALRHRQHGQKPPWPAVTILSIFFILENFVLRREPFGVAWAAKGVPAHDWQVSFGLTPAERKLPRAAVNRYPPPQHVAIPKLITTQYKSQTVVVHEVLVKFKASPSEAVLSSVKLNTAASYLEPLGGAGWYEIKSPKLTVAQLVGMLAADDRIEEVVPDSVGDNTSAIGPAGTGRAFRMMFNGPDDPKFLQQWDLENTGQCYSDGCGLAGYDVNALPAWSLASSAGRASVVVVVYGTGVDYDNPDLAANVWTAPHSYTITEGGNVYSCPAGAHGFNAIDNQSGCTGQVYDNDTVTPGHGTIVAGAVGAVTGNGIGVAGAADNVTILPISICTGGEFNSCDTATAVTGIDASLQIASQFGLHFAAASFSHSSFDDPGPLEDEMLLATSESGVVFAVSTDDQCLPPGPPASAHLSDELVVAASDQLDNPSNWGSGSCTGSGGDVAAPGSYIWTTNRGDETGKNPSMWNGASLSAPIVAGAVALLNSVCPLPPSSLIATIEGSADEKLQLDGVATDGRRLNMGAALATCLPLSAHTPGTATITESFFASPSRFAAGTIDINIAGVESDVSYHNGQNTDSLGSAIASAVQRIPYVTATYEGSGQIAVTTLAKGHYTAFPISISVVDGCPAGLSCPEPSVFYTDFNPGS